MSDSLPLLPGEHPRTVWRPPGRRSSKPPWYRFDPRVPLTYLPPLIMLAVVGAVVALYLVTRTPVVLYVDGDVWAVRTHARTVRGVLAAYRVKLEEGDVARPELDARLEADMVISARRSREVRVLADGAMSSVQTRALDPMAILAEAGVRLGPSDAVLVERWKGPTALEVSRYPSLGAQPPLPAQLRVVRATAITVNDNGQRFTFQTTAPTVGEALLALEEPLYEGDRVEPAYGTLIFPDVEVVIRRSRSVTLTVGNEHIETRTLATSVGELLDELDMPLSGDDYAVPPPETPLEAGMEVHVVRVEEEVLLEEEVIPFERVWQPDPTLELDQKRLLREGVNGVLRREVRVRYEDGVEVSRVVGGEWVAQEPVDEAMGYGTQIVVRTLETDFGSIDYWRHLRVLATSYTAATAGKAPGSPGYGITGTGLPMRYGIIAIDPRVINFFTQMYVPGYGIGLAADAGGAIKGLRIDLGYDEDDLVLWYEWVDVYLLTPVPDPDEMIWVLPES